MSSLPTTTACPQKLSNIIPDIIPDITERQRDRAGASTGSDHPLPFAQSAKSPHLPRASLRAQDRSRGATPTDPKQPVPNPHTNPQSIQTPASSLSPISQNSLSPIANPPTGACPQKASNITPDITKRQRDRAGASTGSDHPHPFAHSAKSPHLPRASLRAQDRSRGARTTTQKASAVSPIDEDRILSVSNPSGRINAKRG